MKKWGLECRNESGKRERGREIGEVRKWRERGVGESIGRERGSGRERVGRE